MDLISDSTETISNNIQVNTKENLNNDKSKNLNLDGGFDDELEEFGSIHLQCETSDSSAIANDSNVSTDINKSKTQDELQPASKLNMIETELIENSLDIESAQTELNVPEKVIVDETDRKCVESDEEVFPKKTKLRIIDSDSEDDIVQNLENKMKNVENDRNTPPIETQEYNPLDTFNSRYKNLIDSDSESDVDSDDEKNRYSHNSDADNDSNDENGAIPRKTKKSKSKSSNKVKIPNIFSDDDEDTTTANVNISADDKPNQSDTQRSMRERVMIVPYNKPQQVSLKEFLNRRNVKLSPNNLFKKNKNVKIAATIKMTPEELEEYVKSIEEKRKSIIEIKKSPDKIDDSKLLPSMDVSTENFGGVTTNVNSEEPKDETEIDSFELKSDYDSKITKLTKLSDAQFNIIPVLKYDPNSIIDLESGDVIMKTEVKSGADKLIERFVTHVNKMKKNNGVFETDEIEKAMQCSEDYKNDIKPRAGYIKLKKQFEQQMLEQRKLEYITKSKKDENEDEDEEDYYDELEECEANYNEEENEDENEGQVEDLKENEFAEQEEENVSDKENESEDDVSDNEELNIDPPEITEDIDNTQRKIKRRIIETIDSDEDDHNYDSENSLKFLDTKLPFSEENLNEKEADDELFDLCSGRFVTQIPSVVTQSTTIETENIVDNENPIDMGSSSNYNNHLLDDDEDDNFGTKKNQRNKRICNISDDDDEVEEEQEAEEVNDKEEDVIDEQDQILIGYDSEENEFEFSEDDEALDEIKNKESKPQIKISKFFDEEAELSESDWNSSDEDEKGLDQYDVELGDEDKFDSKKIKSELHKIHMRRMLNDDDRELKALQNIIMGEEELDGERERKFRWKNLDSSMIQDNENENKNDDGPANGESDEETEESWRKLRYERDLLLNKTNEQQELNSIIESSPKIDVSNETFTSSKKKRLTILKTKDNVKEQPTSDNHLYSKMKIRGSILSRCEKHITTLANLTKDKLDKNSLIETTIRAEKESMFLFVAEDTDRIKRKSEDNEYSEILRKRKKV